MIFLTVFVLTVGFMADNAANHRLARQAQANSTTGIGRVDCYPEAESVYSNFSQATCEARGCRFENSSEVPCYYQSNYGYVLQGTVLSIQNGLRLNLMRNPAVVSAFPDPIQHVALDVTFYTDSIIRFKLYDANNSRYEVISKVKQCGSI